MWVVFVLVVYPFVVFDAMLWGMVKVSDDTGSDAHMVVYSTPVRVPLPGLSNGVKRRLWRDRQIQAQAYNWGVEYVLEAHYRGEAIPSPRNNSSPLTAFRHETGSGHSVLLQRGGFWSAVTSVKKWSKHRRKLVYTHCKACERVDEALTKLDAAAQRHTGTELPGLVTALCDTLLLYRDHRLRRVELTESAENIEVLLSKCPFSGV